MLLSIRDSVFYSGFLTVEVDGIFQNNVIEVDTSTGEALVYVRVGGKFISEGGELLTERVTFPVDKLHIYLVKPK